MKKNYVCAVMGKLCGWYQLPNGTHQTEQKKQLKLYMNIITWQKKPQPNNKKTATSDSSSKFLYASKKRKMKSMKIYNRKTLIIYQTLCIVYVFTYNLCAFMMMGKNFAFYIITRGVVFPFSTYS